MRRFLTGFKSFFDGFQFIRQHKLWRYIALPSLVSLLAGLLTLIGSYKIASGFFLYLSEKTIRFLADIFQFHFTELPFLISLFITLLAMIPAFILALILYRFIASVVIVPFLGPLLSRVEEIHVGKAIEISIGQDIRNALLGIRLSLKFALIGFIFLFISLPLGLFQLPINGILQGYFLGRSSFEYVFEKESLDTEKRKRLVREYRPEILGAGSAFFLVLMVPVIGVLIGPVASLVGAALVYHNKKMRQPVRIT